MQKVGQRELKHENDSVLRCELKMEEGSHEQRIWQVLKTENDPQPTANEETRASVLQSCETEFWQHSKGAQKWIYHCSL